MDDKWMMIQCQWVFGWTHPFLWWFQGYIDSASGIYDMELENKPIKVKLWPVMSFPNFPRRLVDYSFWFEQSEVTLRMIRKNTVWSMSSWLLFPRFASPTRRAVVWYSGWFLQSFRQMGRGQVPKVPKIDVYSLVVSQNESARSWPIPVWYVETTKRCPHSRMDTCFFPIIMWIVHTYYWIWHINIHKSCATVAFFPAFSSSGQLPWAILRVANGPDDWVAWGDVICLPLSDEHPEAPYWVGHGTGKGSG